MATWGAARGHGNRKNHHDRPPLAGPVLLGVSLAALAVSEPAVAGDGRTRTGGAIQLAQADPSAARRFSIPAGDLQGALLAFSQQADVQLLYPARLTEGLRTQGVRGTLAPRGALTTLLAGTGLVHEFTAADTVTISRQPDGQGAAMLAPITVAGARSSSDPGRTEGTGSYVGSRSSVGSKIPSTLRETPQSVSVITRRRMDDQGVTTVDEALRTVPSIVVTPASNGFNPGFQSRGFDVGGQLDGIPIVDMNSIAQFDTAMYDRIEVLRGPAGLFQGQGQPGGAINMVRKRPTGEFHVSGTASYGSWDNHRGEVDIGGPATESGRIRYRFAAVGQDRDFFYDVMHQKKRFAFGAVEMDITERTILTLSGAYQDIDGNASWGQPRYTNGAFLADRSTYVGADWSHARAANQEAYAELTHAFDNGWRAEGSLRFLHSIWEQKIAASFGPGVDPATDTQAFVAYENPSKNNRWTGDVHLSGPVELFGRTHTLLVGANGSRYSSYDAWSGFANLGTFSIFDRAIPEPTLSLTPLADNRTEEFGYYGQARIKVLDPLTVVVGGRLSTYEAFSRPVGGGWSRTQEERNVVTPYAGLIYDVTDTLSVYASYTDVFRPQTNQSPSGDFLEPIVGTQYETGVKAEFLDGGLTAQAALFRIQDQNRAQLIPGCGGSLCYEAAGEVRSQGVDLELAGSPAPGWNLFAGYVYTLASYENGPNAGTRFATMTPRHSARVWVNYNFADGSPLVGLSLGGGIKAQTRTSDGAAHQGAYTVASLSAGYKLTEAVSASLSVNNLFDTTYYETFSATGFFNWPGEPRNVVLRLKASY
ncbi:TonB-dependent siderophore receptor [Azospirillum sp. RWY-5-1]|uniref:TonB-dependent siderophore receptor n=1 Tax=Azospirillum oleiclasticum TaxID=2735135 RepID=A0ABX2TJR1_9PROT|nr:TonB-dependent siderophore receptor [Azospirillum oleiclasticum]NYZ14334.1 TonB-dependent siderophore receptor [Azospirillum oleiclasticum]NYZ23314.1 TonB-dependent siderophore receptor [Azospirillum oleiclasticum]